MELAVVPAVVVKALEKLEVEQANQAVEVKQVIWEAEDPARVSEVVLLVVRTLEVLVVEVKMKLIEVLEHLVVVGEAIQEALEIKEVIPKKAEAAAMEYPQQVVQELEEEEVIELLEAEVEAEKLEEPAVEKTLE